ncbi:MAG: hypothetical protein J6T70_14085 [Bacteroidales bacterium]|nr:hypothetical protein [Bacteroidales bacterium]
MKKVIFGMAVVAAAAFGAYNANTTDEDAQLSDLQMENVEALGEVEAFKSTCKDRHNRICVHWDYSFSYDSKNRN